MTETTRAATVKPVRVMLSKVPEVTVWFWVIKILCTTVGESFADWINMTLGVGLIPTSLIFTVVLVAVLAWQLRLDRYVPFVYWLTVVVVSVTGTLYTDILTDVQGVPLALSTSVFAAMLAAGLRRVVRAGAHAFDPQHHDDATRGVLLAGDSGHFRPRADLSARQCDQDSRQSRGGTQSAAVRPATKRQTGDRADDEETAQDHAPASCVRAPPHKKRASIKAGPSSEKDRSGDDDRRRRS